jgi:hypothetical protein
MKIIDGENYFDEKLLKLIVVDHYDRVQSVVKQYDHLGSHLNNRLSYLQYRTNDPHHPHPHPHHHHQQQQQLAQHSSRHLFATTSSLDQSNKFLVFIVITVLSIVLIGITFIFISLIRRRTTQQKEQLKKQDSISTSSGLQPSSDSSTINLFKPTNNNTHDKRPNLRVSNCYEYNEITSPSSLLILNKDSMTSGALTNDNCCLLDKLNDKELFDEQRHKVRSFVRSFELFDIVRLV